MYDILLPVEHFSHQLVPQILEPCYCVGILLTLSRVLSGLEGHTHDVMQTDANTCSQTCEPGGDLDPLMTGDLDERNQ